MRIWIIVGRNVSVDFVYDLFYWLIDVFLYLPNFFFFLICKEILKTQPEDKQKWKNKPKAKHQKVCKYLTNKLLKWYFSASTLHVFWK